MFRLFIVLFLTVPLLEIFLLLQVGETIGVWWTVGLVVLTAVIGVNLLRMQGISTLHRLQACANSGEIPAIPMIEGAMLLFAGALLLTPGFFTDAVGFIVLFPPFRQYLAVELLKRGVWVGVNQGGASSSQDTSHQNRTIEGEYERRDE